MNLGILEKRSTIQIVKYGEVIRFTGIPNKELKGYKRRSKIEQAFKDVNRFPYKTSNVHIYSGETSQLTSWTPTADNIQHKTVHLLPPHIASGLWLMIVYLFLTAYCSFWPGNAGETKQESHTRLPAWWLHSYSFDMGRLKVASMVPCGSSVGRYTSSANW